MVFSIDAKQATANMKHPFTHNENKTKQQKQILINQE